VVTFCGTCFSIQFFQYYFYVEATQTLCEQSQLYSGADHYGLRQSSPSTQPAPVTPSAADGRRLEQTIYYCHDAIERILKTLLDLGSTLSAGGQQDNLIMMEFDAIGKRRSGSTSSTGGYLSPTNRDPPTLVNYTIAIDSLLAALPPKYNIDVLKALGSDSVDFSEVL